MSKLLMLKDEIVYDIDNELSINNKLLPGYMQSTPCNQTFRNWMKERYNSGSNTLARMLQGKTFGQGNRAAINAKTHALSLSDCYWIKDSNENILFKDISPYFNEFWTGIGEYETGSIPTLYVPGAMSKEWVNKDYLRKDCNKEQLFKEEIAINFCKECNIPVNDYIVKHDSIYVKNFTSPQVMLEQANMSGLIDPYDFTDNDIIDIFKENGVKMIVVDAILGNGDRHAGNFGFLRDTSTGEYISMAPLYDFDHTFDSTITDKSDVLIKALKSIPNEYKEVVSDICTKALQFDNVIINKRAQLVCKELDIDISDKRELDNGIENFDIEEL